jgi:NADPH2:quinone reductase
MATERYEISIDDREAPAIHELPIPTADGAFLIRVSYAGVNPIDYKLLERLNADSTYPFVLGIDFAGVVERVPAGEGDFQAGDRIFGMARTAHTPSTPLSHPA